MQKRNNILLALGFAIAMVLVVANLENGFFWDTVQLGSRHATYYLSTNFSNILLPMEMDSGHIPAFGFYIALLWKIFGRNLAVSHLAMLPFAIGIVWQLNGLCRKFIAEKYRGFALLLVLCDPGLMSQMTLVSPDVPLAFFFLLGLNAIWKNNKSILALGILLLFLTSMRGMMVSVCLLAFDLHCNVDFRRNTRLIYALMRRSLLYLPALTVFIAYNSYHYLKTGWIGYHQDSPWAKSFEAVDFSGFAFNIGMLGWRLLDFGRIIIWIVFFILIYRYRTRFLIRKQTRLLLVWTFILILLLPANMLWAKDLLAHRYLIPIYLVFALLCANMLFSDFVDNKVKWILATAWLAVLLSGNFWIYPDKISKGWDSTLAHLPYYKLRADAIAYLDKNQIAFKDVTSFFPNVASVDYIELNNDYRNFDNFNRKSKYVFYSNIYNIDDETYDTITKYIIMKRFKSNGVYIVLYKKP